MNRDYVIQRAERKKKKKNVKRASERWETINYRTCTYQKYEKERGWNRNIFKEIMAENVPNLTF